MINLRDAADADASDGGRCCSPDVRCFIVRVASLLHTCVCVCVNRCATALSTVTNMAVQPRSMSGYTASQSSKFDWFYVPVELDEKCRAGPYCSAFT